MNVKLRNTLAVCILTCFHISTFAYSAQAEAALTQEVCSVTDDTVLLSPALALRGVVLDDIKDAYLGCHFTGTAISDTGREGRGCNVRKTPDGNGLRVEFQIHDDKYVKCVLVDLTDGEGGVWARKVGTGYKKVAKGATVGISFGDVSGKDGYEVFCLFAAPAEIALCNRCAGPIKCALIPKPREMTLMGGTCASEENLKVVRVAGIPAEGYELSVTTNGVTIHASDEAGEFYAQQTLSQLKKVTDATIPCCEIKDSPRFKWRGVLVDDARHFMGKEMIKRTIDEIAKYKFNVFHWHLTDDPSWRIDVPGYPELLNYGDQYLADKNQKRMSLGPRAGCRYYTREDVKEIVEYAAARHVKIVPEIDFPGHFFAVACAYPEFVCNPESVRKQGRCPMVTGFREGREPMCVGNPDAVKFVEAAIDAVCDLFPNSDVIHIGGDECHFEYWKTCPKCQALMKRENMEKLQDIQAWLTRRAVKRLEKRGRRVIGWDEIFDAQPGILPSATMGMYWHYRGAKRTVNAVKAGHKLVACMFRYCYFDYRQGLTSDPYRYIGGHLPLSKVYIFDPFWGLPPECHENVIGGQCCNWGEFTFNGKELEWKLWPRAMAMAEILWTYPDPKIRDFEDFKRRATVRREEMVARGINAAPVLVK